MVLVIRAERPDDFPPIRHVVKAAFPAALEAALVDRLRDSGDLVVSLVAESEGQIVGHVAFSPVTIEDERGNTVGAGLGLAPVAVLPQRQRSGIGSELIRAGLQCCRAAGHAILVVLGEPEYYRRFGFRPASNFGLTSEYQAGDAFMALLLDESAPPRGLVRYAPVFAALG